MRRSTLDRLACVKTSNSTWGIRADSEFMLELGPGNTFSNNAYGDVSEDCG